MARRNRGGIGMTIFHLIFGLMTGGLWWVFLFLRHITR